MILYMNISEFDMVDGTLQKMLSKTDMVPLNCVVYENMYLSIETLGDKLLWRSIINSHINVKTKNHLTVPSYFTLYKSLMAVMKILNKQTITINYEMRWPLINM